MSVVVSVSFACTERRARSRTQRASAKITGNPIAPRNTAIDSTLSIHTSAAKSSMPCGNGTKPVFVKADSDR